MLEATYVWLVEHKDGLLVLGAVSAPFVSALGALVAATISYRASVRGPSVQREIAQQQLRLSAATIEFQRRQALANLQGNQDQKWLEDLRKLLAKALVSVWDVQKAAMVLATDLTADDRKIFLAKHAEAGASFSETLDELEIHVLLEENRPQLILSLRKHFTSKGTYDDWATERLAILQIATLIITERLNRARQTLTESAITSNE